MSLLLFIVGAIALMAGVSMAAYGIPINEFSFGNTLIVAGCSLAAGGLIVIGLGAVVAQLHRIAETLTVWSPGRSSVADLFDDRDRGGIEPVPTGNRVLFPPRPQAAVTQPPPKTDRVPESLAVLATAATTAGAASAADDLFAGVPSLRNPQAASQKIAQGAAEAEPQVAAVEVAVKEEVLESPAWLTARAAPEARAEPSRFGQPTDFDSMWPEKRARAEPVSTPEPEPEPAPVTAAEDVADSEFEPPEPSYRQGAAATEEAAWPQGSDEPQEQSAEPSFEAQADEAPQEVAVLKSGVVDGMAYTLYVDGSIEAELPQGTLRFSSINDLRNYLENNA